jgi:hypothetical protein
VSWTRWGGVALVVGVYAAVAVAAHVAGFRMRIPWGYFQLVDGPLLRDHPLGSLCFLHSQPPGLNALLAAVLRAASALDVPAPHVAAALFFALGLAAALALAWVTNVVTGSRALAGLAVLALLADPGFHVHGHVFFYEFIVQVLVCLLLAASVRHLRDGRGLAVVAAATVALALTRVIFHPLWAVGYCALLIWLRARLAPQAHGRRIAHAALAAAILVPALAAWPLKNWLVYGRFTSASMNEYSFSREVPGCADLMLQTYVGTGSAPDAVLRRAAEAETSCGPEARGVAANPTKADGSRNWHHVAFLEAGPRVAQCAMRWRLRHPGPWLSRAAGQYAMWSRPTFVHPYRGALEGPADAWWRAYATAWSRAAFLDLRPAIERGLPGLFLHREARLRGRPVPYTVFGFVLLPVLLGLAVWQQIARPPSVRIATAAAALACLVWPMLAVCLTDGQEGNRMRYSTTAAMIVVAACLAGELRARRRGGP